MALSSQGPRAQSHKWMQQALVNWYAEMQERGPAPSGANAMQAFVCPGQESGGMDATRRN